MIRIFHAYFPSRTLLLALSEAVLVFLALLATTSIWFGRDMMLHFFSYENALLRITIASLICMLCMYYYDLYDSWILRNKREAFTRLVQVLGTACLVMALLFYAFPSVELGHGPLLTWLVVTGVCLGAWRTLFLSLSRMAGLNERIVFFGAGPLAEALAKEIVTRPELGLSLQGVIRTGDSAETIQGRPVLGTIDDLPNVIERDRVERVIITMGDRRGRLPVEELLTIKARGVHFEDAADLYEAITGRVPLAELRPSWLLLSDGFRVSAAMRMYKRLCSIVFSAAGLLLTLPVMAFVAILIRLDSPGPVLFRQKRVGKGGKVFWLYKFRSMVDNADKDGAARPAEWEDNRFTRVGRLLRRTRLDEVPQLYNIFKGDMSFIGPRPFTADMEAELVGKIPYYSQRWNVKPGATGWAQVQRGYCVTLDDNIEKLSFDLFYIKNLSVGLDCLILFQTIKILMLGRGAQ
ncbi:MAG: sugar transferase [Bryobacteraceae bacterium]